MTKYLPAIEDCANFPKHGYSLKHLILTTPYSLESETAVEDYRKAWSAVHSTIESVFYEVRRQYATSEEKRRKRISLKLHGIGLVVAAEYGEKGNKLHFHCLLYSPYVPIGIIPQHWKEQTGGDCTVTRIRKVNDAHAGAKEIICKYVTKFTELDPGLVPMLHKVLFGSRRIRTYGIFFNLPDIEEERLCLCPVCDSGLKYIRRQDYDIATGRVISTYLDKLEISRGKDPPHGGNNGVSGTSQTPQETFAQLVMGGFDAEHLLKRPKGHYSQD